MLPLVFFALTQITSFGSNPGALDMYEYIPPGLPAGRPLVVVLHGCTQSANAMVSAGWNQLADQYQFAVVYPQQTSSNNPVECFNWAGEYGDTANLVRGQGENQSIMSMVDYEVAHHGVDASKVYIMGFSAGAAFTTVMLATWPDRFAGGAIMEGIAYRCATSVSGAYSCQSPGVTKTAAEWGDLVRAAHTGYAGPWPRVQIWEGTSDTTVVPANQAGLVKQWTNVWGIDQTADENETIGQATRAGYKSGSTVAVETYSVQGMSHAVSVGADPSGACTATAGQYFEDHHVCATLRAARFFGLTGNLGTGSGSGSGDDGDPTVAIVSPADGDMVSGAVTVVVAAGNADSVDLAIDGAAAGTDSEAPYQFAWDATMPGEHTLVATAHGATQDATAMATVTVASGSGGGGSGGGGGSNSDNPGPGDLPACSLDAGKGGLGLAPIAMAALAVLRRRRQRV